MTSEPLSKKTANNVLILGRGYIGNHLAQHLKQSEDKIYQLGSEEFNYHNTSKLTKFILNNKIETVVNCSGFTGRPNVDEAESKKPKCWFLNVMSPLNINRACNILDVDYIHISSGCIYTGYEKEYTEKDDPNFGLFDESSFYSKSKHAFELMSVGLRNKIVRIRMPICNDLTNPRNYLKKIMEYPNLIDYVNSKTYIPELCGFIKALIEENPYHNGQDIYNVVNSGALTTNKIILQLNWHNEGNWNKLDPNWVGIEDLKIIAPRSNCVLDNSKAKKIYPLSSELEILNMVCNYNNGIQAT
jgi:UDP-glucose 4,6-dehydratase